MTVTGSLAVVAALLGGVPPGSASEVAVVLTGESVEAVEAVVRANGGDVSERLELVRGVAAALPAARLRAVEDHPVVDTVSVDAPVHVQGQIDSNGIVR